MQQDQHVSGGPTVIKTDEQKQCSEQVDWLKQHPCLLTQFGSFVKQLSGKRLAVFLDYDGTLTPIVSNPDEALMSEEMRAVVRSVAQMFPTAIISGRGREKVELFVGLPELYYAGSHGMDIRGPQLANSSQMSLASEPDGAASPSLQQPAAHFRPIIDSIHHQLCYRLQSIPGSSVEHNTFCVSAHFRNVDACHWPAVARVVEEVAAQHPQEVCITRGRKVLEIRPKVDWHKGTALLHLVDALGLREQHDVVAIYLGDDNTDEDAFRTLEETQTGFGVLVSSKVKPTRARYTLKNPEEVLQLLRRIVEWGKGVDNGWHLTQDCVGWIPTPVDGVACS